MSAQRVVLVAGDFVKTGGMDRANYALAEFLAARGDEVHLVGFRAGSELLSRPGVAWHQVPKPLGSYTLGLPFLDRRGRRWGGQIAGARVVVNGGNCRFADVNWVHHVNALDRPGSSGGFIKRWKRRFDHREFVRRERRALAEARVIVTTCERNRADLVRLFGLPIDRIRVVYYGVDPGLFRPASLEERAASRRALGWPEDRPAFLFVGGLGGDRRKGFDTLHAAWSSLCQDPGWTADLKVAGTGPDLEHWKARTAAEGLTDRIEFLGFRRDVPSLLRAADAHVLPSRYEGYSLITHEAICCGIPAYVTASAGIAERYPAVLRDLLIPDPDDAPGLADRLRGRGDLVRDHAADLADFAGKLRLGTWDDMAGQIAAILDEPA